MVAFNTTIDFFDTHSGTFTVLATILLVIVTSFLVNATRQLTDVSKKMWLAQDKPWLYFYIKDTGFLPGPSFCLFVKNIGKGPALNILFDVDLNNQHLDLPQAIATLPPNEELLKLELSGSHGEVRISEISYEDINRDEKKQLETSIIY